MKIKTGFGYDVHKLVEGRKLFLGGVEVPFSKGLIGHSDGDCLIHAVVDALLGAAGERDIGQCFPDTDPKYKNVRSTSLLKEVVRRIKEKNVEILNIDSIIIAEKPHLASYVPQMKEMLCSIINIRQEDFGIKAKTNEGLGIIGQGKAIAALAVVLVQKK